MKVRVSIVVALLVVGACGAGTEVESEPGSAALLPPPVVASTDTSTPATAAPPTSAPATSAVAPTTTVSIPSASPPLAPPTIETLGDGSLAGVAPPNVVYYVAPYEGITEPGCEGVPDPALWRLDLNTGALGVVTSGDMPVHGQQVAVMAASTGSLLIETRCEEHLTSIAVYHDAEGADLGIGRALTQPATDLAWVAWDVGWSPDGETILLLDASELAEPVAPDVWAFDAAELVASVLFSVPATRVAEAATGEIVAAGQESILVLDRDGRLIAEHPGTDFCLVADGTEVAVINGPSVEFGRLGGALEDIVEWPEATLTDLVCAPSAPAVAYRRWMPDPALVVTSMDGESVVVDRWDGLELAFTGVGFDVVYSLWTESGWQLRHADLTAD